jgi:DNA-binding Xre family transcriptional regulator
MGENEIPAGATLGAVETTEAVPEALAEFFATLDRPPGRVVNRVARLMAEAGLSQRELARRSGVSTRAVSELARGLTCRYDAATLARLSWALDCGVGDLLAYEPLPKEPSGLSPGQIERKRIAKREARGSFERRVMLVSTD